MTNRSLSLKLFHHGGKTAAVTHSTALQPSLSAPQAALRLPHHAKAASANPLWLCAYFPELPLESAGCQAKKAQPFAIFEESRLCRVIYMASAAASAASIARGMRLSQAYALCPALKVKARDTTAEIERLRRLAAWAGQFTPVVSLQPPQALLLEISGSLRLFGGLDELKNKLSEGLSEQSHCAHIAITLTPLASLLLASQGQIAVFSGQETADESEQASLAVTHTRGLAKPNSEFYQIEWRKTSEHAAEPTRAAEIPASTAACAEPSLHSALSKLPVSVLPLNADSMRRLNCMGIKDLHDLWRLPREGLARRFEPELLNFLDRALGLKSDPRHAFHPSPRFTAELELPWETDDTAVLLEAVRCLFTRLGKFLHKRDLAVARLRLTLHHAQSPPSRLEIGTRHGTRDEEYLLDLLKEHLYRFRLPAAACKLRLTTTEIQPFTASNRTLFAKHRLCDPAFTPSFAFNPLHSPFAKERIHKRKGRNLDCDWQQVLDQLQVRLSSKTVQGLQAVADHRPEWAWNYSSPGQFSHAIFNRQRPLWLLPTPQPLASRQGQPWRRGPLSIVEGPERIESGWWEGRDISRDYYLAKDTDSSKLWIFRELRGDRTWYLHGLFG
jgi:protein ImuB